MKKVTLDYCGRKETLPFTKDCLIDISRVIPKVTGVKFRISPGNITYPKFLSQLTKLCHFTGELSGVDSSGALREGVTNIHLFHIQSYINNQFCGGHLMNNIWFSILSLMLFLMILQLQMYVYFSEGFFGAFLSSFSFTEVWL